MSAKKADSIFDIKGFANSGDIKRLHQIADHYGVSSQLDMLQEECAELIQAISKYKRYQSSTEFLPQVSRNLFEELADVFILFIQVCHLLRQNNAELNTGRAFLTFIKQKLDRTELAIENSKAPTLVGMNGLPSETNTTPVDGSSEYIKLTANAHNMLISYLIARGAKYNRTFRLRFDDTETVTDWLTVEKGTNIIYKINGNEMVSLSYMEVSDLSNNLLKRSTIIESSSYTPKYNGKYFYVTEYGEVHKRVNLNSYFDHTTIKSGNCFGVGDSITLAHITQIAGKFFPEIKRRIVDGFKQNYGDSYTIVGDESWGDE